MAAPPLKKSPTIDEMRQRMHKMAMTGFLAGRAVSRHCGGLLLCHPYRPRRLPLYPGRVYLCDASMTGRGIGSMLMDALIARCEEGPWRQMIAVIGDGQNNAGSLRLHKKHGFEIVGQLRSVGYKKGDWRDTVIMQRPLNDGDWTLPE
jgi:phosphinothricin acetyltransferase